MTPEHEYVIAIVLLIGWLVVSCSYFIRSGNTK